MQSVTSPPASQPAQSKAESVRIGVHRWTVFSSITANYAGIDRPDRRFAIAMKQCLTPIRRFRILLAVFVCLLLLASLGLAATSTDLVERTWMVDGVQRTALVHIPPGNPKPAPAIFDFHGHGGTQRFASRANYHVLWPEAVVIYPQGLPTKGMTDTEGNKAGWQQKEGDNDNRDLKFFDAMLDSLKKENLVDEKCIFATGHSNGGRMTYLLWETRPQVFAAFAPSASPATLAVNTYPPRPAFILASPKDQIVPFAWQQRSIDAILKLNQCDTKPEKWQGVCSRYPSKTANPVITYIHDGGHMPPADAPALITQFFKLVAKK